MSVLSRSALINCNARCVIDGRKYQVRLSVMDGVEDVRCVVRKLMLRGIEKGKRKRRERKSRSKIERWLGTAGLLLSVKQRVKEETIGDFSSGLVHSHSRSTD